MRRPRNGKQVDERAPFALSSRLLEYVGLGVPLVSADLPTIREHSSDEEVRFVRAGDGAGLAEALLEVASDATAASAHAEWALERHEAYRWRHTAMYAELLSRITSQASRRGV